MSADTTQTMTMAAALNLALADSLADDPSVLVFGEDVGALGGVFRVTDGLTARFGEDRRGAAWPEEWISSVRPGRGTVTSGRAHSDAEGATG